nr:hypothetical protein Iba_chr05cCG2330 [Ipomoea batatas]
MEPQPTAREIEEKSRDPIHGSRGNAEHEIEAENTKPDSSSSIQMVVSGFQPA